MRTALTLLVALLILALGLFLLWHVALALRTGVAQAAGGRKYPRRKRPLLFTVTLLGQLLIAAVLLHSVARCLGRLIGR